MSSVLGSRRLVGGLAGAVVVALLAIAAAMAEAKSAAVRDVRVFGSVEFCGRSGCHPVGVGKISARTAGRVVATHTYHKGRYSFPLVPGSYTLVATPEGWPSETKTVNARGHRSTRVDFKFSER